MPLARRRGSEQSPPPGAKQASCRKLCGRIDPTIPGTVQHDGPLLVALTWGAPLPLKAQRKPDSPKACTLIRLGLQDLGVGGLFGTCFMIHSPVRRFYVCATNFTKTFPNENQIGGVRNADFASHTRKLRGARAMFGTCRFWASHEAAAGKHCQRMTQDVHRGPPLCSPMPPKRSTPRNIACTQANPKPKP